MDSITYRLKLNLRAWDAQGCVNYISSLGCKIDCICEKMVDAEENGLNVYLVDREYTVEEFLNIGIEKSLAATFALKWGDFSYEFSFGYFRKEGAAYLALYFIDSFEDSFRFFLEEADTDFDTFLDKIKSFNSSAFDFIKDS